MTLSNPDEKVLDHLRKMNERVLHTRIIHPLLEALGAQQIRYTHGAFERGKDFVYVLDTVFGTPELVACQVKNEKLSGNSSKLSASTNAFLNQAVQCKKTEVQHPITNVRQTPDRVVLISTYDLPDGALADQQVLLSDVRSSCTFVGPKRLIELLKRNLQEEYEAIAFPGSGLATALRRYVSKHHEADAFEMAAGKDLETFYVNIGIAYNVSSVARLLGDELGACLQQYISLRDVVWSPLNAMQMDLSGLIGGGPWISINPSAALAASKPSRDYVNVNAPKLEAVKSALQQYLDRQVQLVAEVADLRGAAKVVAETLDVVKYVDDFVGQLEGVFDWSSGERLGSHPQSSLFRDVPPESLLKTKECVFITGEAGAGKTCIARMAAQAAIDSGLKCIYFPCSFIQDPNEPLESGMKRFLASIAPQCSAEEIDKYIEALDVVIVDGCDESVTYRTRLARDLASLALGEAVAVALTKVQADTLQIPDDLSSVVRARRVRGQGQTVGIRRAVSSSAIVRLVAMNKDKPSQAAAERLGEAYRSRRRKVIVTSRSDGGFQVPSAFTQIALEPFTDEQVVAFFARWFGHSGGEHEAVVRFLNNNPYIKDVCRIPINATIVAAAFQKGYDLPRSRSEVYHMRFDLLLDRWDRARRVSMRNRISKVDKYRVLSRIALGVHKRHARTFERKEARKVWEGAFQRYYPNITVDEALYELQHVNSVVCHEGQGVYSLGHLSYQEYLAAYAIVHEQMARFLVRSIDDPWWHQVAVFYAGISGDITSIGSLMQNRAGLRNPKGVLEMMMEEARYTGDEFRVAVGHMLEDELGEEESSDGSASDLDVVHYEDDEREAEYEVPKSAAGLQWEGEFWRKWVNVEGYGECEFIVEVDSDGDGRITDAQMQAIEVYERSERVWRRTLRVVIRAIRDRVAESLLEEKERRKLEGGKAVDAIIRKRATLESMTIPLQRYGNSMFYVYVSTPWDINLVVKWEGGRVKAYKFE